MEEIGYLFIVLLYGKFVVLTFDFTMFLSDLYDT